MAAPDLPKHTSPIQVQLPLLPPGLANFAGALSNCYTTTGSFSRSAVNNNSGAKSPLSQFVCAWTVGFVLIFLTPVFEVRVHWQGCPRVG